MNTEVVRTRGFKAKTIEATIKTKINDWIKKSLVIEGNEQGTEDFQKRVKNSLTGGAITSMLLGELPNDFDVYFSNGEVAAEVAKFYVNKFKTKNDRVGQIKAFNDGDRVRICIKSAGIASEDTNLDNYDYFEGLTPQDLQKYFEDFDSNSEKKKPYHILMVSTNAITLADDVQLILRFVGPAEEIHKNYDFVHCTNYYTEAGGLVTNKDALLSTLAKELKYVGSKYPLCSMFRIKKFIKRGWTITAGEMLKISWDTNVLDLNNVDVLQDQLVGVDAAYFHEILQCLKKEGYGKDKPIERTYLFEVVNRIFDESEDF